MGVVPRLPVGHSLAARIAVAFLLVAVSMGAGERASSTRLPSPADVLGFAPGTDYQLADFRQLDEYFRRLDDSSDRVRVYSAGRSTDGRDILVAVISSEANLAALDRYQRIARRLALVRGVSADEARALAAEGKAIVWIDNGLHASEVATAQHALVLAHRVAGDDSAEMRAIRDNVILVLLPCVNPDGMQLQVDWYRRTLRTPHQDSPMPWLYQRYVGHDNNRDAYMQTQAETRVINRLLYRDWLPQIMFNQHQGTWPPRIFVPPFPDPFNPNIDPQVMRAVDLVGGAMLHRFERDGKDGVISRYLFSTWYNGSIRTTAYFHNMVGILTETGHASATPFTYDPADFPAVLGNGVPSLQPSSSYPRPWRGGRLRLADAIDYMLTASLGVLEVAGKYREAFLHGIYQVGARQIALGLTDTPVAYVVPAEQHDEPAAREFLETLRLGAIEIHRARAAFTADGHTYPAGSHVIWMGQPFRPFAKDLLEPQNYPDVRPHPGASPQPPYDTAGWTLAYQMGVAAVPVATAFQADLEPLDSAPAIEGRLEGQTGGVWGYAIDARANDAFIAVNRLLAGGTSVRRTTGAFSPAPGKTLPPGTWIVEARTGDALRRAHPRAGSSPAALDGKWGTASTLPGTTDPHAAVFSPHPAAAAEVPALVRDLGLRAWALRAAPRAGTSPIRRSRIGLYKSWVASIDEGWTRWVFERYGVPYRNVHDADVRAGALRASFDVIVLADQSPQRIVDGHRPTGDSGSRPGPWGPVPPEYQGGLGETGVSALQAFVRDGGVLVALDESSDLLLERFGDRFAHVRNVTRGLPRAEFYCPGSVLRIAVETSHPVGYGMAAEAAAYFADSRAFATSDPSVRSIARYAADEGRVLMSGWLLGARRIADAHAALEVPYGKGRAVLFAFRPQFRAQPHGTFKLLLNAVLQ